MNSAEQKLAARNFSCPVCQYTTAYLDSVNFNKSCEEGLAGVLPPSDKLIDYFLCDQCGFCFVPEMYAWSYDEFGKFIYNQDYEKVDPDYKQVRPQGNANLIDQLFASSRAQLCHLDYGGGSGLLSRELCDKGWDSTSYDPFVNADVQVSDLGCYDLVTAFEVFEHVTDIPGLMHNLRTLCKPDGLVLFSTLLSDGEIEPGRKVTWWYASPRNGHISLFSAKSLQVCMQSRGFRGASFTPNLHLAYRQLPTWASHLVSTTEPQPEPSPIQSKLEAGIALHVDGNFSQAQLVYEEILAQQPQHYDALHLLGVLAMQAGDFERAVDFFGKAIAIHPNNFGFYINQGNALKGLVRLDAALASFDKAIALNPEVPDIHVMRGEVLQELFQFDAAIASFDQAIAINPGFHAAQEARAHVLRLHDQK